MEEAVWFEGGKSRGWRTALWRMILVQDWWELGAVRVVGVQAVGRAVSFTKIQQVTRRALFSESDLQPPAFLRNLNLLT